MKKQVFTHPQACYYAKANRAIAYDLLRDKTFAVRHTGEIIKIHTFVCYTQHSEEASRMDLLNADGGVIAYFANGQFRDLMTGTVIGLS